MNSQNTRSQFTRQFVFALTFLTGLTALVYEVVWHRYLANLLGSQAKATALILAVFLGGLSIGYAAFGNLSGRWTARRLVFAYGVAELAIGVWVWFFPAIFHFVWSAFGVVDPQQTLSLFWDILASAALIGVPTILMGGTLPLLTQALSRDLQDSSSFHAKLYAVNTAGAVFGCLLAGFYMLPEWGLAGTMKFVGPVNVVIGLIFALILPSFVEEVPAEGSLPSEAVSKCRAAHVQTIAVGFLAGFISLTLQTIFVRLVGLSMGSSDYAFSMVVAVFVAMLAFGAWGLSHPSRQMHSGARNQLALNQAVLYVGALALYLSVSYWPYAGHLVRTLFSSVVPSFYAYHVAMFLVLSLVLIIPVGAMGRTLPLSFFQMRNTVGDLGAVVGRVYAANTFGCVLGATFGGYILLYSFDLDRLFQICLSVVGLTVVLALPEKAKIIRIGLVCLLAILPFFLPLWNKAYLVSGLFRYPTPTAYSYDGPTEFFKNMNDQTRLIAYRDDPNTTVSVSERDSPASADLNSGAKYVRSIRVNGKSDGETSYGDMRTMRLTAHIPALLAPIPLNKVAVVGFGLGVTAGSFTLYPEVKDIHVMEISPAVKEFSPLFDFANSSVSTNEKVRWSIGDAYRVLAASPEKYSLIVSEPSNPWVVGVERLFAKDFYELVKQRLEPGGTYAQWIHYYSLSRETLALVVNTFHRAFPSMRVFRTSRDIILIGSVEPLSHQSLQKMKQRYEALPEVQEALRQLHLPSIGSILGTEIWMRPESLPTSEEHTLEFPRLSFRAGRDFFAGDDTNLRMALDTTPGRMWARSYAESSLIRGWLNMSSDKEAVFRDYTAGACEIQKANFFSNWKQDLKHCRDALVALAVGGALEPKEGLQPEEVRILQQLRDDSPMQLWEEAIPKLTVADSLKIIGIFASYDSIFSQLSAERLLIASTPCLKERTSEAFRCRLRLANALCVSNFPNIAQQVLRSIHEEDTQDLISPGEKVDLQKLIEQSSQAAATRSFWFGAN